MTAVAARAFLKGTIAGLLLFAGYLVGAVIAERQRWLR